VSKKKHVLHTLFWGEYLPIVTTKCDFCEKMFQVKKGFVLLDDFIICYKHLKEEFLKRVDDVRKK